MKLEKLKLKNFRAFKDLSLSFPQRTTVVIGQNGAGKTSILDAIAICMTHFTGELLSSNKGYNIDAWFNQEDITNSESEGSCKIMFSDNNLITSQDLSIEVLKSRGRSGLQFKKTPENFIKELKEEIRDGKVNSVPVIVYFNVHRTYPEKQTEKTQKTNNNLLSTYEKALELKSPSFKSFEKWFTNQINEENAFKVKSSDLEAELPGLKYVRKCISTFMNIIEPDTFGTLSIQSESDTLPDFSVEYNVFLTIHKSGSTVLLNQLSDGEKMVIGLVAEIARRVFLANKTNPEKGGGIVLIDEIELHLHPKWQKSIISALEKVFPNLSFIFTTHSPLVLSGVRKESIKVMRQYEEVPNNSLPDIYTATADEILERLMGTYFRYNPHQELVKEIDQLFNKHKFDEAYSKLEELKSKIDSNPEWLKEYFERIAFVRS